MLRVAGACVESPMMRGTRALFVAAGEFAACDPRAKPFSEP